MVESDEDTVIIGHLAKANEQWRHFQSHTDVLVIFQGPHAYISPSNYQGAGVPTWNYAAVHMYGLAKIMGSERQLKQAIDSTLSFLCPPHDTLLEKPSNNDIIQNCF